MGYAEKLNGGIREEIKHNIQESYSGMFENNIIMKKVISISLLIILGMELILNNCGDDWTECDDLCQYYCHNISECVDSMNTSEINQCEQSCQDVIGELFTENVCVNITKDIEGMNCTEFKRYLSGCHDECSTVGSTVCSGNGYKTCEYNDSDGCFEYSSVINCGSSELCIEGNCIQTYSTIITLGINNLCYNGEMVKYRYFGVISGEVWPSSVISDERWPSSGYYSFENIEYENNIYTENITCLVGDNIC